MSALGVVENLDGVPGSTAWVLGVLLDRTLAESNVSPESTVATYARTLQTLARLRGIPVRISTTNADV